MKISNNGDDTITGDDIILIYYFPTNPVALLKLYSTLRNTGLGVAAGVGYLFLVQRPITVLQPYAARSRRDQRHRRRWETGTAVCPARICVRGAWRAEGWTTIASVYRNGRRAQVISSDSAQGVWKARDFGWTAVVPDVNDLIAQRLFECPVSRGEASRDGKWAENFLVLFAVPSKAQKVYYTVRIYTCFCFLIVLMSILFYDFTVRFILFRYIYEFFGFKHYYYNTSFISQ